MVLNPFQVRLRDDKSPEGYKTGLVGTVIGMVPTHVPGNEGQQLRIQEIYKVLWFNLDEETGDLSPYIDAAAPSSHLATELVSYVDEFEDSDEDDGDEDYDDDDANERLFDDEQPSEI